MQSLRVIILQFCLFLFLSFFISMFFWIISLMKVWEGKEMQNLAFFVWYYIIIFILFYHLIIFGLILKKILIPNVSSFIYLTTC